MHLSLADELASFTVSMARKDVRLMVEEAAEHGCPLVVIPAVAAQYDAAIARGESAMVSSAAFRPHVWNSFRS